MRKLVVKTSFITLGVCLILLLSLFGVLSLCVPYEMSKFTANLGLYTLSGDYAYQEYERSGDIEYLARSFEIAAERGGARKAESRFTNLIAHEEFEAYCTQRDEQLAQQTDVPPYKYKDYVYGRGARAKYRLAQTAEEKERVCAFALEYTENSFPAGNPVMTLAVEGATKRDAVFCAMLLKELQSGECAFAQNANYTSIVKILEEFKNE